MRDTAPRRPLGGGSGWRAPVVAGGFSVLIGSILAARWRLGPVDDAFITLRYAANWAMGRGLCFNPGERVEGYTNFLLVLLQAAGIKLGLDPVVVMRGIGWIGLGALAYIVARACAVAFYESRGWLSVPAAILITLNPAVLGWAVSGLETVLYALLLLAGILFASGDRRPPNGAMAGACLILAGLTRPEAMALFPFFAFLLRWNGASRREILRLALLFLVGYGSYFAFRAVWFGSLFPNTFYAKLDYGNTLLLQRGLAYVWSFVVASPLIVLFSLAAIPLLRGAPGVVRGCAIIAAAHLLTVVYEGGDHFALYRFIVPVLPILCVLALHPWVALAGRLGWIGWRRRAVVTGGLAILAVSALTIGQSRTKGHAAPELEVLRIEAGYSVQWEEIGRYLRRVAPREASLSTTAIGAIGFYSDLRIIDPLGLVNPTIAHRRTRLGQGKPGHEKFDAGAVFDASPSYLLIVNLPKPEAIPENQIARLAWGRHNSLLLQNPRLHERYRHESILVRSGWWAIYVRKDLPPLTGAGPGCEGG